jgi:hypothetical protein
LQQLLQQQVRREDRKTVWGMWAAVVLHINLSSNSSSSRMKM